MSIYLKAAWASYPLIYATLRDSAEAEFYRTQLLQHRVSTEVFRPEDYAGAIGSLDFISCLGCIFTAKNGRHIVNVHHDGRDLKNLFPLFTAYQGEEIDLDITCGIQMLDTRGERSQSYDLLDPGTKHNFETLIDFVRFLPCTVHLNSWTISDVSKKEGLVCEYVARGGRKIVLLETGTLRKKCLPPEYIVREVLTSYIPQEGMQVVVDTTISKELNLKVGAGIGRLNYFNLWNFAKGMTSIRPKRELLESCKVTPKLEPEIDFFCETMRKVVDFVLSDDPAKFPKDSHPLLPEHSPCIIVQGEAGRICQS